MSEVPTKTVPIDSISPHPENYNQHPESQIAELAESDQSFGQYRNVVVWSPDSEIDLGNGYWLGRRRAGRDKIEVKDYTGLPYEDALLLMKVDNAAPLGAQLDPDKLRALLAKTRELAIDRPKLGAMLSRLAEKELYGRGVNRTQKANDPMVEWVGMPEFEQEDLTPFSSIKVHFKTLEDRIAFAELVEQTITDNTKFIWYPQIKIRRFMDKRYIEDDES